MVQSRDEQTHHISLDVTMEKYPAVPGTSFARRHIHDSELQTGSLHLESRLLAQTVSICLKSCLLSSDIDMRNIGQTFFFLISSISWGKSRTLPSSQFANNRSEQMDHGKTNRFITPSLGSLTSMFCYFHPTKHNFAPTDLHLKLATCPG